MNDEVNAKKLKPKSANPIESTIESVPGYPSKLKIFKVNCSRYYWGRVFINGSYQVKSLKTESRKEALEKAIKFYEDALVNIRLDLTKAPKSHSFAVIGRVVIESLKDRNKPRLYADDNSRFKKELLPFFGEMDVALIKNANIRQFITKLRDRNLNPSTINHYIIVLRRILNYCVDNGLIDYLPKFPKIEGKTTLVTKRDYFDRGEIEKLIRVVEEMSAAGEMVRWVPITLELKYLVQFMVASFIRPSDLRVLKHKHIRVMINENQTNPDLKNYLLLSHPATKTTDQQVVTMPDAYYAYCDLYKFQEVRGMVNPDDYLFLPEYKNRNTMIGTLGRCFRAVVRKANITAEGESHTLYSLRHSAIMFRLMMGNVNTLKLARNARTSQLMIERFYASRLTNLMGVDELHGINSVK